MAKLLQIVKAVTFSIGGLDQPVVTNYQLGIIIFSLYISKKYDGQKLRIRKPYPDSSDFNRIIGGLQNNGVLKHFKGLSSVYSITGKNISSEDEIVCSVDPFSYISHLSAMSHHGITDRVPKIIFIASPSPKSWREFANEKMKKDLRENLLIYNENYLPKLIRVKMEKVGKKVVNRFSCLHLGAYKNIKNKRIRVSTIGRTFLDMIKRPDLCAGIYHVIEIYKEYAERYLELIIDEIDRHGSKIDTVRAGYILEELCGLKHNAFDRWLKNVQRGGSRKLDPTEEYSSNYSERWCLSINI